MLRWLGPFCLVAAACGLYVQWGARPIAQPPGVLAPDEPHQQALSAPLAPVERRGWRITPVAEFAVEARVLSTERYYLDATASISPIDVALGWGALSDSAVLAQLRIWQSTRFFHYRYESPPIPPEEIVRSASNMHMIPADPAIDKRLKSLREGEVVRLRGYLVDATRDGGGEWRSSLVRTDTGPGACEIVYVTEVVRSR